MVAVSLITGALAAVWVSPVTGPLWEPSLIALAAGLAISILSALGLRFMRVRVGVPFGLAVMSTALVAGLALEWAIPVRLALVGGPPASRSAALLRDPPLRGTSCTTNRTYLDAVRPLMSALEVCPGGGMVSFEGTRVSAPGVPGESVVRGLIYAPSGKLGPVYDTCVRHLYGPWWVYQGLLLSCPYGMKGTGGP